MELHGVVRWFDVGRGFGFVTANGRDVFVPHVALPTPTCVLPQGTPVRVVVEEGAKGLAAKRLDILGSSTSEERMAILLADAIAGLDGERRPLTPPSDWEPARVKWYAAVHEGYGFLAQERASDIFLHATVARLYGFAKIAQDTEVECRWVRTKKGRACVALRLPDEARQQAAA